MLENIRLAFQGIWSHKMRSFLTMLGIIIGIASIIAIVSTIKGTSEQIKEDLIGSGNNTVQILLNDGDSQYDAEYSMSGATPPLISQEQKDAVMKLKHIEDATFYYSRSYTSNVYYQNTSFQGGKVFGIDDHYLNTCGYTIQSGRGFVSRDYEQFRKVALIDTNAQETLFPGETAIGKTLEINQEPFVIVGVITQSEDYLPDISTYSEYEEYYQTLTGSIMIPDKCWPMAFKFDEPVNAVIKADSTDTMSSAGNAAAKVLNNGIDNSGKNTKFEYKADDVMERVRNLQKLSESTNNQLIWIASISLLVGGIGVMNIMLVSVTERTSEIGLKKAIGARKKTILAQFLTEASVLTSIGGLIGVIVGIGLSRVVGEISGSPVAISIPASVIAVLFSMAIGLIFGLLPSITAANLNPIEALRSE
ncbi:MAG: ABC transporter permease [Blautia sp.]|nr:ABC transporter permease [Blautia sp.]MDY5030619.1 ABC transporter permease [Blautia sp.]